MEVKRYREAKEVERIIATPQWEEVMMLDNSEKAVDVAADSGALSDEVVEGVDNDDQQADREQSMEDVVDDVLHGQQAAGMNATSNLPGLVEEPDQDQHPAESNPIKKVATEDCSAVPPVASGLSPAACLGIADSLVLAFLDPSIGIH